VRGPRAYKGRDFPPRRKETRPQAVGVFRCTRRLKPSGHVSPAAPLLRGETGARRASLRLLAAAVALLPRTHVKLQHDVEIVGRWRRRTNVWREVTSPARDASDAGSHPARFNGSDSAHIRAFSAWCFWGDDHPRRIIISGPLAIRVRRAHR
jgi:hypothetical protein